VDGAAPLRDTVAETACPPWTLAGVTSKLVNCTLLVGSITSVAVSVAPFPCAVIVAVCGIVTVEVPMGN
jgi:hypothetical protein